MADAYDKKMSRFAPGGRKPTGLKMKKEGHANDRPQIPERIKKAERKPPSVFDNEDPSQQRKPSK